MIPVKTLKCGFSMPVFGFGTWMMGGGMTHDPSNDDAADIMAIERAIDAGITHIDTAEMYAAGHAEHLVGKAIKGRDRSKLLLVSKVSPQNLKYGDVMRSCEKSLKRLGTDYLDLYLIHKPNDAIGLKETMQAMNKLQNEGLIRNIGVSNFTKERMREAQMHSDHQIVATQVHLNLAFREPERKRVTDYCRQNDAFLIAWRPVQGAIEEQPEIVKELCAKYGKTPVQIALNWLVCQDNVVTLAKMRHLEHLEENLGAFGWEMEKEDVERLRTEYPNQRDVSDAVPLA